MSKIVQLETAKNFVRRKLNIGWAKWGVETRVDGSIAVHVRKSSIDKEVEMVGSEEEIEWLRDELSAALRRVRLRRRA